MPSTGVVVSFWPHLNFEVGYSSYFQIRMLVCRLPWITSLSFDLRSIVEFRAVVLKWREWKYLLGSQRHHHASYASMFEMASSLKTVFWADADHDIAISRWLEVGNYHNDSEDTQNGNDCQGKNSWRFLKHVILPTSYEHQTLECATILRTLWNNFKNIEEIYSWCYWCGKNDWKRKLLHVLPLNVSRMWGKHLQGMTIISVFLQ